jgi:hypothetical protein
MQPNGTMQPMYTCCTSHQLTRKSTSYPDQILGHLRSPFCLGTDPFRMHLSISGFTNCINIPIGRFNTILFTVSSLFDWSASITIIARNFPHRSVMDFDCQDSWVPQLTQTMLQRRSAKLSRHSSRMHEPVLHMTSLFMSINQSITTCFCWRDDLTENFYVGCNANLRKRHTVIRLDEYQDPSYFTSSLLLF